ncbi:MAG: FG-GAP repeat protein, partial [Candidatus Omnitrophica bacterium]|nr:FG-GAP repeat protein [Candidatus Omnitrophota bacterium]
GRAYVYDGSSGALLHSLRPDFDLVANFFGRSVAGIEDLDGDGRGEVLVAAYGYREYAGRVHIFSGSTGETLRELIAPDESPEPFHFDSLAVVPDANGDGVSEILAGAPNDRREDLPTESGGAVLYDPVTGGVLKIFESPDPEKSGRFGKSVSGIPDVNGDGRGDILIGAPSETATDTLSHTGRAHVFDGSTAELLYTVVSDNPRLSRSFGTSVLGLPDLDGDGLGEFAVGDSAEIGGISGSGRVYLFSGKTGKRIQSYFPYKDRGEQFGNSLAFLPDSNGDASIELLIGDQRQNRVYAYFSPLLPPRAIVQPRSRIDFGTASVTQEVPFQREVQIGNQGFSDLVVVENEFRLSGEDRNEFTILPATAPAAIPPGATHSFEILFTPKSSGFKQAILTFHTNDPDNPIFEIEMSGWALDLARVRPFSSPNPEEYGHFGKAVDGIPDLNGNGSGEAIIGAWLEDPGLAPANAGRVYVVDASTGETIHTLSSPNEGIYFNNVFGHAVSSVPDTNGDGSWDILVGAYYETQVFDATSSGAAYLFDGASGELLHSFYSPNRQFHGWFGWTVSGCDDLNGDGRGDVLVGAIQEPRSEEPILAGTVYVFDGATGDLLHELFSPNARANGRFGLALSGVPDTDGDGLADVVVGAPGEETIRRTGASGKAYIFSGSSGELLQTFPRKGEPTDVSWAQLFGSAVVGFEDLNGDGRGDIAVSAPRGRLNQTSLGGAGIVYIFDGATGDQLNAISPTSNDSKLSFGTSLSAVPDTNLDGYDDLLIGSNLQQAFLHDGRTGFYLWKFESPNEETNGSFARIPAGLPDANGDGRGDILIGAENENPGTDLADVGRSYAFFSPFLAPILNVEPQSIDFGEHSVTRHDPTIRTLRLTNEGDGTLEFVGSGVQLYHDKFTFSEPPDLSPLPGGATRDFTLHFQTYEVGEEAVNLRFFTNFLSVPTLEIPLLGVGVDTNITILRADPQTQQGRFGTEVAGLSDMNGDGFGDVAVTVRANGRWGIRLFDGVSGASIRKISLEDGGFYYWGIAFDSVPDVNLDGIDEIVVGDPSRRLPNSPTQAGAAYLFDGATGDLIHTVASINAEWLGLFGSAVAGIPDTNGDGRGDFIVGAYAEDPGPTAFDVGRAYIYDGSSGELLHELVSEFQTLNANFGYSVAGTGDLNGDGFGDVIVGSPGEGGHPVFTGRAYIFDGSSGELLWFFFPPDLETPNDFGKEVSGIPDIDNDGLWDIAIAAPGEGYNLDGGPPLGRVYVYSSFDWRLLYTIISPDPKPYAEFGESIRGIPDVTGDTHGELLVGSAEEGTNGRAYLFNGVNGTWLRTFVSPNRSDRGFFGQSVAALPDADGDGLWDVVIGAPGEEPAGSPTDSGRAYLFYSSTPLGLQPPQLPGLMRSLRTGEMEP